MDKNLQNQGSDNRSQNFSVPKDERVKENTNFTSDTSKGVDHSGVGRPDQQPNSNVADRTDH